MVGGVVVVVWGKKDDVLGKGTRPNVKNGTRKLNLNSWKKRRSEGGIRYSDSLEFRGVVRSFLVADVSHFGVPGVVVDSFILSSIFYLIFYFAPPFFCAFCIFQHSLYSVPVSARRNIFLLDVSEILENLWLLLSLLHIC